MTIIVDVTEIHPAEKPEDVGWAVGMCDGKPWMAAYDYPFDRWRVDEPRDFSFGQRVAIGKAIRKRLAADPSTHGS